MNFKIVGRALFISQWVLCRHVYLKCNVSRTDLTCRSQIWTPWCFLVMVSSPALDSFCLFLTSPELTNKQFVFRKHIQLSQGNYLCTLLFPLQVFRKCGPAVSFPFPRCVLTFDLFWSHPLSYYTGWCCEAAKMTGPNHRLHLRCPQKTHVLRTCSPEWHCWKVVEPLKGGAE